MFYLKSELKLEEKFYSFVEMKSEQDDTWFFWSQYVFHDCCAYVNLFLSIRTSNWYLRQSSLKLMVPLYSACDSTTYQKLIPHHIADIVNTYPDHVRNCLQSGAFTVSITGHPGHSVALDESHEMCINKDFKMAVVRPTKAYLKKTALFFGYRISAHKNFISQLFPESTSTTHNMQKTVFDHSSAADKREQNIDTMKLIIANKNLLPPITTTNRGLINVFSGQKASTEQSHDLLAFRQIGLSHYENYVKTRILKEPSTKTAVRKRRLLTFSDKKMTKRKISQLQHEHKQVTTCLRRRLAWCSRTGKSINIGQEQYSIYPRALSDCDGNPHTGSKSIWTTKYASRYNNDSCVLAENLPVNWIPDAVLIDGMFLINTNPLHQTENLSHYSYLLFNHFMKQYFQKGSKTIHLLFDNPNTVSFNPKALEQSRRDKTNTISKVHNHVSFSPDSEIKRPWRDYINCRQCKRSIIEALGLAYLKNAQTMVKPGQTLILAGCFSGTATNTAWVICGGQLVPQPEPLYNSNSPEADT